MFPKKDTKECQVNDKVTERRLYRRNETTR